MPLITLDSNTPVGEIPARYVTGPSPAATVARLITGALRALLFSPVTLVRTGLLLVDTIRANAENARSFPREEQATRATYPRLPSDFRDQVRASKAQADIDMDHPPVGLSRTVRPSRLKKWFVLQSDGVLVECPPPAEV